MEAPISLVGADTLLALLENHSNIDPASLTALACTNKDFAEGVNRIWTSKMAQYAARCEENAAPPIPSWMDEATAYYHNGYKGLHDGWPCDYYGVNPRVESKQDSVRFEFECHGGVWTRETTMMTVNLARQRYFLKTEELRTLPCTRGLHGARFYHFTDVLQAAMLRHGRDALAKKMVSCCDRIRRKGELYFNRVEQVDYLLDRHYSEPGMLLTPRLISIYCSEYYVTGHGKLKEIKQRFESHRFFTTTVSLRSSSTLQLYLSQAEQDRESHLQIAYVITKQIGCVEEAINIVTKMRLAT